VRVLFATTAGAGHFGPLAPFADACRRQGHEVLVAAPASFAGFVERAGYPFRPFDDPAEEDIRPVWEHVATVSPEEANELVVREIFARFDARAALPGLRRLFDDWRPDVVLRDPNEYSSAVAAELYGVAHVRVGFGLAAVEEGSLDIAATTVSELRESVGLRPDEDGAALRRSPYLTLTPASFEAPGYPLPSVVHRFRNPTWDAAPPPLHWWPAEDDRPFVYVTLGSVAAVFEPVAAVYRTALEAVAALPVRALLTVGDRGDPAALGSLPSNVRVERWVAQAEVLGHAAAVVNHGGSGSVLGCLAVGAPMVVVPLFADQPYNARRVAELGAGVAFGDGPPDAEALRDALRQMLEDGSYRQVAHRIADELRALPPTDAAVALLEKLAANAAASRADGHVWRGRR
jgi:UDP:flavonoid glycosyltransferase YjiC (YdhE family)